MSPYLSTQFETNSLNKEANKQKAEYPYNAMVNGSLRNFLRKMMTLMKLLS